MLLSLVRPMGAMPADAGADVQASRQHGAEAGGMHDTTGQHRRVDRWRIRSGVDVAAQKADGIAGSGPLGLHSEALPRIGAPGLCFLRFDCLGPRPFS